MVKNLPVMRETWVRSPGWDDPLEKAVATHSSMLVWRIPMDRGSVAGYSPWGHKSDTTERLSLHFTLVMSTFKTSAYEIVKSMGWDQRENKYREGKEPRTTLRNSKIDCQSRVRWACKMNWARAVKRSSDNNVTEIRGKDCFNKGVVYHISLFNPSNFM